MNLKSFDFLKEDLKLIYETFNYKTIEELIKHIEHHEKTEEEKKEEEIEKLLLSMHKHKRKEKQDSIGLRKDPFNVLFDEEIMLRY